MAKKTKPAAVQGEGFWSKPARMNLAADILLLLSGAVLAWAATLAVQRLPVFPLREVVVMNSLHQVTSMQVDFAVRDAVRGNFFTVDPDAVRGAFEKLPWVRRVEVRRRWPDTLELTLEEQVAAARWQQADGESRLVNDRGEVFVAAVQGKLPTLAGPPGSAAEVLSRYREFHSALAPLGRELQSVVLSQRLAWQLKLDGGLMLELGRDGTQHPIQERLTRFVADYHKVEKTLGARLLSVDMRYPNGFAVRAATTERNS